ncbi:MAG: DNA-processing protein DprA [Rhodobacter sp.]|nr:DNA-processing protein DprA [Rhodobacter sp.]
MAEVLLPSPHPLTPPRSEEDWVTWLRLLRSRRVGPTTFFRLITEHGDAAAALDALPDVARAAGVEDYRPCPPEIAAAELKAGHLAGAQLVAHGSPAYPKGLLDLPDAPPFLWCLGDGDILSRPMIALVGARNASSLGTRMARKLAEGLTDEGFVVVSGLARGVDTAAHLASLDGGTCAVLAGGVDVVYPIENAVLAQEIAEKGVRISEQAMGLQPQARHFPTRNRIISGIAQAVVVVEAASKSGSLITAKNALDQGREVLAVPGHPFDARAAGCNMLLRDGAQLVRSVEDVIEAVSMPAEQAEAPADNPPVAAVPDDHGDRGLQKTSKLHSEILSRLGPSPVAEDQLIRDLKRPANAVASELVALELDGKIARQAGGLLSLA